jgi:hypothetical protein
MVQTPVGARCPSCARMSRLPTYKVSGKYYLRAIGAALGIAIATGLVWTFIRTIIYSGFFNIIIGAAVGYGIGEVISLASNRKRGIGLAIIAGTAVVASYLISSLVFWGRPFSYFDIIIVIVGIVVSVISVH